MTDLQPHEKRELLARLLQKRETQQHLFRKWAAHDLQTYRQSGICPPTGDRKRR